jgi:hypothetical protein
MTCGYVVGESGMERYVRGERLVRLRSRCSRVKDLMLIELEVCVERKVEKRMKVRSERTKRVFRGNGER